jgi:hypothetical protein
MATIGSMHGTGSMTIQPIMGGEPFSTLVALAFNIRVMLAKMLRLMIWPRRLSAMRDSTHHGSMELALAMASQLFQALEFFTTGASNNRMIGSSDSGTIQFGALKVE